MFPTSLRQASQRSQQQRPSTRRRHPPLILGQVALPAERGEYWLRCRLCSKVFKGSSTKAVDHFLKVQKPCAFRTGEIVDELVAQGGKVNPKDKNTLYMLQNFRGLSKGAEGGEEVAENASDAEDPSSWPVPPPVRGQSVPQVAAPIATTDDEAAARGDDGTGGGEACAKVVVVKTQTTIRKWIDNNAQKKLDIAWAEAMFRAGIAFNFLNFDTTQALHDAYLEVASGKPKVKLPTYKHMRTVMLDYIFLKVQKSINPLTACWDKTCCTFITNGSTDRKNWPVMNFLAAGEKGAVLVTTVYMTGRKKNAAPLAKLWEQVMREIGLKRINAICTDNAEVNKKAAQILERRTDRDIARILWVPCGAHCCSLLLKDLSSLPWVKDTVKTANTIVKFIKNHHATHGLMMSIDDSLSLLRPTEVRFGSVYQMLHRLEDRAEVLNEMVDGGSATKWRALRWSGEKLQKKADLVYYTVRSENWWAKVRKIVAIMEPVYSLLKRMDREGVSPTNLVEFDDLIARKLANIVLTKKEREDVMYKVKDRVQMMRQPVHAAAFLLDPRRRDAGWLNDLDNALVHNATRFFCRQIGAEWDSKPHMDMRDHLYEFLREHVEGEVRTDEHMWTPGAIKQAMRRTPADWWTLHGGDVPALQEIAITVLGMWSTATPAERNWASMDFVHSKCRNSLSPKSLEKLVYIHWNMQLLRVPNSKDNGYVDVWGSFFEPLMEPTAEDGAIEEPTEDEPADNIEEEKRQKRLKKTPKNRIPKRLLNDDSSGSSDLEDLVWKGKYWNKSTSEEGDGEDDIMEDSNFELGSKPAVPATTYVGRRLGRREKEAEVLPSEPIDRLDTDIEFLAHPMPDADEEEAARAKVMADRNAALVRRRMCEEEARRAAVPTRRERERQSKQVSQHKEQHSEEKDERVDNMEVDDAAVRAKNEGRLQHAGVDIEAVGEKNVQQEEEKSSPREGDDMEDVDKTQQQGGEEVQEPAPPTVYTRRPRPSAPHQPAPQEPQEDQQAVVAEQPETLGSTVRGLQGAAVHSGRPPYPAQNEDAQHDNIWKSRAGRKRKAPVNDVPHKPRRRRGRPCKEKTGHETAPKSERGRGRPCKLQVSEDDPDSDARGSESPDDENSKGDSE
ncbi:hypothetical protein CBR_g22307 [Chara braunii]|uniref:DUF659 domain-containing protein n=1 Tax=Chara braunii TaxID=69332 RepID=A0A388L2N0_CHABU|nr:hypothetical protein CBR_g22307 [Chara braunii]|eukprot:GBG76559.1 hypothetical protein CBR_g22307 [Chara braunii]